MRAGTIFIGLIRFYQRAVSPWLGPCCRFYPSCSEFMARSIALNGALIGVLDGLRRLLKCHPLHPGGVDEPRRIRTFATGVPWKNG